MTYLALCLVLAAWTYDNLLLIKLQHYIRRQGWSLLWMLMKTYTKFKTNKNEMIKDGYHIDFVYLYEKPKSGKTVKYDVTSVFRKEILEDKFNNGCELSTFVNSCCKSGSNLKPYDEDLYYRLEIRYTFDLDKYKVFFDTENNEKIIFPLYTEREIRTQRINNFNSDSIVSANLQRDEHDGGIDVIKELKEIAGPLETFYKDKGLVTKVEWGFSNLSSEQYIFYITLDGEFHTIRSNENI